MVSYTAKTYKNGFLNLYNRFLFCNTFLLPVRYLHPFFTINTCDNKQTFILVKIDYCGHDLMPVTLHHQNNYKNVSL